MLRRLALLLALCLGHSFTAHAQTRPETIRGRVTSDSGVAIVGATVSATMAPDRTFQQATTDSSGRFSIHFAAGTGDYLIHVSALGFKAVRKRLMRAPGDTSLVIDLKLSADVAKLAAVKVTASKPRPDRDDSGSGTGSSEQQREGVFASVAPGDEGNLAAIANAIPGASVRGGSLSVLGLDGSQSNTTLNGMAFGGAGLPRDARTQVRVTTSTYDPSRGGFSGGQIAVELSPGGSISSRTAHLTGDAPPLQAPSTVGDQLGQRFASLNGSIGGSGELEEDVWYYNSALQLSRRMSDAPSLLSAGTEALTAAGIAPDSVLRLTQLLGAARVPIGLASIPSDAISQTASFAARLDHTPYKPGGRDPSPTTWNVNVFGNVADDQAQGFNPSSIATHGGRRTSLFAGTQLDYSKFFGDVLNDTRMGLSVSNDHGTPYLYLPGGTVLLSSTLPDGGAAINGLTFGGNGGADYSRRSWTWETINETQWYTKGAPHRVKLTVQSRLDGYQHSAPEDLLGAFSFPSLAALQVGQPSSYSRTLLAPSRTGGQWSGFLALGDYWRATQKFQLLYGARVEANRFTTSLSENDAVASAFGVSTSHAPSAVHVSPRLGFTWYLGGTPGRGYRFTSYGTQSLAPTMMLRGGVGEFRNLFPSTLLADASVANGLPGGVSRLSCIGAAAPVPQWNDYLSDPATLPTTCAGGAPPIFTDASPTVRAFDRSYGAPRSWRGNLAAVREVGPFSVMVDGVYSINLDQPGIVDRNFSDAPQFTLSDEGNRPVFVAPSSISATSGAVSPVEARVDRSFGRVIMSVSDLRSTSRQLTATLSPKGYGKIYYSLAYTLGDVSARSRGFDGGTFASPLETQRAPGDFDVRHQVIASLGTDRLPRGMNIAVYARFSSGLPYTPRINGDVNGDGLANDRAFVFDPARVADAKVANDMRALLAGAPSGARECLVAQLGRAAEQNSCRGPWTSMINARIGIYSRYGFTRRQFRAVLHLTNPAGGLDQLLHGGNGLHGWGGAALPDPTLLTVRGFDPTAKRFQYEVNPRFGSTESTRRIAAVPFRITLDLSFDLGEPMMKQLAGRLMNPGRRGHAGSRMAVDTMVAKLRRNVSDPYQVILDESDSLLVTRDQSDSLKKEQVRYTAHVDSTWRAALAPLVAMGDDYDANAAMKIIDDATEQAWLAARDEVVVLERILSPLQMRLAPFPIPWLVQAKGKPTVGIRMMTF